MTDATADPPVDAPEPVRPRRRLPLILGLAGALLLGGGGFFAVYSGLLLAPAEDVQGEAGHGDEDHAEAPAPLGDIAFVPIDPLVINLGQGSANRHLKFRAQLEVEAAHQAEVEAVMPRVLDVLNGYLRAVSMSDLESPTALIRLRAQMLRRIQIVTGEGRVRDLLVMEFVLN